MLFSETTQPVSMERHCEGTYTMPHPEFSVRTGNWQNLPSSSPGHASYSILINFFGDTTCSEKTISGKEKIIL